MTRWVKSLICGFCVLAVLGYAGMTPRVPADSHAVGAPAQVMSIQTADDTSAGLPLFETADTSAGLPLFEAVDTSAGLPLFELPLSFLTPTCTRASALHGRLHRYPGQGM
jgi:hypothetical protein